MLLAVAVDVDTLLRAHAVHVAMHVTVDIKGGETREVSVADDATYGEVLAAVEFSPQEATALVDGQPVPADAPVEVTEITVLRLVAGG